MRFCIPDRSEQFYEVADDGAENLRPRQGIRGIRVLKPSGLSAILLNPILNHRGMAAIVSVHSDSGSHRTHLAHAYTNEISVFIAGVTQTLGLHIHRLKFGGRAAMNPARDTV